MDRGWWIAGVVDRGVRRRGGSRGRGAWLGEATPKGDRRTAWNAGGRRTLPYAFGIGLALLVASCATGRGAHEERGMASWYGGKFHGRRTANGEVYDMYGMTAAHKTLPFNSMVEVRNLDNGRSTVVRINDRGPFKRGRIIDLSYSAAEEIGMIGPGTAKVKIRVVKRGAPLDDQRYTVQVGSFRNRSRAQDLAQDPAFAHLNATVEHEGPFYRVLVGDFKNRDKALDEARRLEKSGFTTLVRAR